MRGLGVQFLVIASGVNLLGRLLLISEMRHRAILEVAVALRMRGRLIQHVFLV